MPSVSRAQHNLMEMVAHDPSAASRVGVPQSVGQEFSQADKGRNLRAMPEHAAKRKAMAALLRKR